MTVWTRTRLLNNSSILVGYLETLYQILTFIVSNEMVYVFTTQLWMSSGIGIYCNRKHFSVLELAMKLLHITHVYKLSRSYTFARTDFVLYTKGERIANQHLGSTVMPDILQDTEHENLEFM